MLPSKQTFVRVAIACNREDTRARIQALLEQQGLLIVAAGPLESHFLRLAENCHANVLLVELEEICEKTPQVFETLLEQTSLPMLFNEGAFHNNPAPLALAQWARRVSKKLTKLATSSQRTIAPRTPLSINSLSPPIERKPAQRVWVLGASVGGPQALRRFLNHIPGTLPVAFIVAQHIGNTFLQLFVKQLSQCTCFSVQLPKSGHILQHEQLLIATETYDLSFDNNGYLTLLPPVQKYRYSPSIDSIMGQVSDCFGPLAGAIIFSGMGDDGAQGCRHFIANGGIVWAQDADSCEISSMPDYARATGAVSFSAPPEGLAERLIKFLENANNQDLMVSQEITN